jgi:hypothetical protein
VKRKNKGSSFNDWLKEEGIYEEVSAAAVRRVLARQIECAMEERQLSKAEVARRMHTRKRHAISQCHHQRFRPHQSPECQSERNRNHES